MYCRQRVQQTSNKESNLESPELGDLVDSKIAARLRRLHNRLNSSIFLPGQGDKFSLVFTFRAIKIFLLNDA